MSSVIHPSRRRERLLALLQQRDFYTVAELKKLTGSPHATLHRDLTALAGEGILRKSRGGVELLVSSGVVREYDRRVRLHVAQKQAIARSALERIHAGDHVFLDASSTCYYLGKILLAKNPAGVTIVTNSLHLLEEYRKSDSGIMAVSTGGTLDRELGAFLGTFTEGFLAQVRVARVFVSAAGWSADAGTTTTSDLILGTSKAALAMASECYCLADSSKYGRDHVFSIAPLAGFSAIITDSGLDLSVIRQLRRSRIPLIIGRGGEHDA
ncbi:MAG: DeoR/GlpR family DNA-binding transcription regulator [Kiritimatiellia bacterium]|nr:DeoR/GlpR family DNA-binding transcription regulator [Lentisphaerota bacterium]